MLARTERLSGASEEAGELRSPFQRDRDRVLYSGHLRRLSGITQVTTPSELHAFHNRLTHTLEVAQVARRIAERTNLLLPGSAQEIDPDVCEAASLAHDLGHPPFGHSGERVLDLIALGMLDEAKPSAVLEEGFEANAQSLRILLKLAVRSGDAFGLDLTAATIRASVKYPWVRGSNPSEPGKFGVYASEIPEFERIWEGLTPSDPTPEGQIMDWADDVAYSIHDFYDFTLAGLIPISELRGADALALRELLSWDDQVRLASDESLEVVAKSLQSLPKPPLSNPRLTAAGVGELKQWVSRHIRRYAGDQIEFSRRDGGICFLRKGTIVEEVAILKALTYQYAIGSPALTVRREGEKRILSTLFGVLDSSLHSPDPGMINDEAKAALDAGCSPTRVILDLLSAMTDAQAVSMYHKLMGMAPISVFDVTATYAF